MKRKVVNPNPQEKKMQKIEEKIIENEIKEEVIEAEEELETKTDENMYKEE